MINDESYDFSFSGLKTALRRFAPQGKPLQGLVAEIAHELQEAIVEVLVKRVVRAVEEFKPKSVLLGGGVASNNRLRQLLKSEIRSIRQAQDKNSKHETKLFIPPIELCTDNAVMIGTAAFYNYSPIPWQKVKANPGLEIV